MPPRLPRLPLLRLLVVEDHAFQRSALVLLLRNMGIGEILEAADGRSALERMRAAAQPVDVVISDLDMPGMDGMEFLRHLGQSQPAPSVVLATAVDAAMLASLGTMAAGYGVDLLGVLRKPVHPQALADVLARHGRVAQPVTAPAPAAQDVAQIRRGLEAGEFEPFFQPKVHIAGGAVAGFEALARWRTAGGIVGPAGFVAQTEAHGLMDALTWSMLDQSLAFLRRLGPGTAACCVCVNLSVTSLRDPQFAADVAARVAAAGLEPRHLVLEVTESDASDEALATTLENLTRLRMRGFGLAIDDFGTGYSSLERLARVPFTELKIDRSFVRNATGDAAGAILLESSLDMARRLKLATVAEGVETQAQWDLLRRLGCDMVQGYLVARPMDGDAALRWLAAWNARPAAGV